MVIQALRVWLASRARTSDPTTIVLHSTAGGSVSGAIETLRGKGFSYHYLIAKDGAVVKCVPASRVAFHAGNSYGPRELASGVSAQQSGGGVFAAGCSVNDYTVGIAFINLDDGRDPYTPAQIVAAISLIRQLRAQYPSIRYLTTHRQVSWPRKIDPYKLDWVARVCNAAGLQAWKRSGVPE